MQVKSGALISYSLITDVLASRLLLFSFICLVIISLIKSNEFDKSVSFSGKTLHLETRFANSINLLSIVILGLYPA